MPSKRARPILLAVALVAMPLILAGCSGDSLSLGPPPTVIVVDE